MLYKQGSLVQLKRRNPFRIEVRGKRLFKGEGGRFVSNTTLLFSNSPITVLLHEIGHGLGVILSSKAHAHIYLGNINEKNKENFRLGRLHFHIIWSFIGYCSFEKNLNKRQRVIALLGGPAMSLLISLLCLLIALNILGGDIHSLLRGTAILNFFQFFFTIIPITYPRGLMPFLLKLLN